MSEPIVLTPEEIKYLRNQHYEEVVCRACKEWTAYGESCCGETECESCCPVCIEKGYV